MGSSIDYFWPSRLALYQCFQIKQVTFLNVKTLLERGGVWGVGKSPWLRKRLVKIATSLWAQVFIISIYFDVVMPRNIDKNCNWNNFLTISNHRTNMSCFRVKLEVKEFWHRNCSIEMGHLTYDMGIGQKRF